MDISTKSNSQTENTVAINATIYRNLVRDSEQLRILKNFVEREEVYGKDQIKTLIKAMDEYN